MSSKYLPVTKTPHTLDEGDDDFSVLTENRMKIISEKHEEIVKNLKIRAGMMSDVTTHVAGQLDEIASVLLPTSTEKGSHLSHKGELAFGSRLLDAVNRMLSNRDQEYQDIVTYNFNIVNFLNDLHSSNEGLLEERKTVIAKAEQKIVRRDASDKERILRMTKAYYEKHARQFYDEAVKKATEAGEVTNADLNSLMTEAHHRAQSECDTKEEEEYQQYQNWIKEQNIAIDRREYIKSQIENGEKIAKLARGYQQWSSKIVNKIMNTVGQYENIMQDLNETVASSNLGERILAPYKNENITGIIFHIRRKYEELEFSDVTHKVLEVLSFQADEYTSLHNPIDAAQKVQALMTEWESKKILENLSLDILFSLVFTKGLKQSKLTAELLESILLKQYTINANPSSTTPIFDHLMLIVKAKQGAQSTAISQVQFQGKQKSNSKGISSRSGKDNELFEAHAVYLPSDGARFRGIVTKEQGHAVRIINRKGHARTFPYLAVDDRCKVCPKCYDADGSLKSNACEPVCCKGPCNVCGYYGHVASSCLQTHDSKGDIISKSHKKN
jgi:hypothetical protein